MSGWTHVLCGPCYRIEEPGREPVRLNEGEWKKCCRCGRMTECGIYYRNSPDAYPFQAYGCGGAHLEAQ